MNEEETAKEMAQRALDEIGRHRRMCGLIAIALAVGIFTLITLTIITRL